MSRRRGRGGNTGPELTYYGAKNPQLLNFAHVTDARTMFNWNVQHLTNAGIVSPHTQVPAFQFNFSLEQARACTAGDGLASNQLSGRVDPDPEAAASAMTTPSPTASPTCTPTARHPPPPLIDASLSLTSLVGGREPVA